MESKKQKSSTQSKKTTSKLKSKKNQEPLIRVRNVAIQFGTGRKVNKAVRDVTFDVYKGETFGLVGESGSGKTTIGRAIMGIQPIHEGTIYFKNRVARGSVLKLDQATLKIEHNIEVMLNNQNAATIKINNYLEEYKRVYHKYLYSKYYDFKTQTLSDYPDGVDRSIAEGVNIKDTKLVKVKKEANIKFITTTIKDNLKRLITTIRLLQKTLKFVDNLDAYVPIKHELVATLTSELKTIETKILAIKDLENEIYYRLEAMNKIRSDAVNGKYTSISRFMNELGAQLKEIISTHKSISALIVTMIGDAKIISALCARSQHKQKYLRYVSGQIKKNEEIDNKLLVEKFTKIKKLLKEPSITQIVEQTPIFKDPIRKETRNLKKSMQMIFQDPASSLNDHLPVEQIIGEGLANFPELYKNQEVKDAYLKWYNHDKPEESQLSADQVKSSDLKHFLVKQTLTSVGMLPEHLSRYPHEFSGGQRQRIGIARALVMRPEFIVADEPISALDASIRAQVINLLTRFQKEYDLTYIFIAHDLSIVHFIADRIAVLYHGDIVELAPADTLFDHPLHPYTKSLLSAVPLPDPEQEKKKVHFVYNPQKEHHDYLVDFPVWQEVQPNHFVFANNREFKAMQKQLKKRKK
ncbi:Vitamin B12 import ATP-binding protein BtuD [Mesoplasma sp. JKS002658]|uniref:ATP-binding cassette domain-containing protein n=1 Tax=Mesoplasma whartonense TaxID=2878854 RepID=UPI002811642B|nr:MULTISPECIES: ATP-binding cassette domain-containing protein [unclassified Mesoplasma]MCL8211318.1 Vitamin B12 import ATP-binding protein BtuD [Mesoplasma sp. JKS002664]MCL8212171.1 Vitamin B12 import ATP-binding protein BtuD [Mesoplasma sp. JKS002662]MCL8213313.1 Vitamin B12 import ATP-binding protein BtuD [Mesoplasma sp. JKS002660]MCL8214300.1 Vitamin B12 import ATP-binding protein BtuD [Mesoplasma sp. JKS002658]MCL8214656.1 Vitamin B12 import ATP-binding protein BtuD [Mesoplasma sp. JKS0